MWMWAAVHVFISHTDRLLYDLVWLIKRTLAPPLMTPAQQNWNNYTPKTSNNPCSIGCRGLSHRIPPDITVGLHVIMTSRERSWVFCVHTGLSRWMTMTSATWLWAVTDSSGMDLSFLWHSTMIFLRSTLTALICPCLCFNLITFTPFPLAAWNLHLKLTIPEQQLKNTANIVYMRESHGWQLFF